MFWDFLYFLHVLSFMHSLVLSEFYVFPCTRWVVCIPLYSVGFMYSLVLGELYVFPCTRWILCFSLYWWVFCSHWTHRDFYISIYVLRCMYVLEQVEISIFYYTCWDFYNLLHLGRFLYSFEHVHIYLYIPVLALRCSYSVTCVEIPVFSYTCWYFYTQVQTLRFLCTCSDLCNPLNVLRFPYSIARGRRGLWHFHIPLQALRNIYCSTCDSPV